MALVKKMKMITAMNLRMGLLKVSSLSIIKTYLSLKGNENFKLITSKLK